MKTQEAKNQNTWTGCWKAFISLILIACYMKLPASWDSSRINSCFPRIPGTLCYLLYTYKMVDHGIPGSASSSSTLSSSPNFPQGWVMLTRVLAFHLSRLLLVHSYLLERTFLVGVFVLKGLAHSHHCHELFIYYHLMCFSCLLPEDSIHACCLVSWDGCAPCLPTL